MLSVCILDRHVVGEPESKLVDITIWECRSDTFCVAYFVMDVDWPFVRV